MVSIKKFKFQDKELLRLSNKIRTLVFVEEQNVDPELEYEFEEEGNFYLMYFENKPIATARWRETDKGIKLERFALLKDYRNRGLGTILLKELISDVLKFNKSIYLNSQVVAVNYYKRQGFVEKGNRFMEANIEHILMEYQAV